MNRLFEIPAGKSYEIQESKEILLTEVRELARFCQVGLLKIANTEAKGESNFETESRKITLKTTQEIFCPMLLKLIDEADEVSIDTL